MADAFQVIPPRTAPVNTEGFVPWLRSNLFGDVLSSVTTLALLAFFVYFLPTAVNWLLLKAVWVPNFDTCQAARGSGACWGVVAEKYRVIIFGRYPLGEQWRPEAAMVALVGLLVASCVRRSSTSSRDASPLRSESWSRMRE